MMSFLQGLTMGLAYVAPIGVQNLFVINTALARSRRRAFATALIVVFFDVTLALACFFGVGAVMSRFSWLEPMILLCGSLVLLIIGTGLLRTPLAHKNEATAELSLKRAIVTACVVTWFNPQAVIDGTMMLGAFRATLPTSEAAAFLMGVVSASCLWFLGLTATISLFSHKFDARVLRAVNVVCGAVIVLYGIKLLYSFLTRF